MFNTTQPFVYLYAMYVRIIRSFNIGYFIVNFGYKYLPALIQITFVVWLTPLNFNYCLDNVQQIRNCILMITVSNSVSFTAYLLIV